MALSKVPESLQDHFTEKDRHLFINDELVTQLSPDLYFFDEDGTSISFHQFLNPDPDSIYAPEPEFFNTEQTRALDPHVRLEEPNPPVENLTQQFAQLSPRDPTPLIALPTPLPPRVPTPTPMSSQAQHISIKVSKPDDFDGKRSNYANFDTAIYLYLGSLDPQTSDTQKINAVLSYMKKDHAALW